MSDKDPLFSRRKKRAPRVARSLRLRAGGWVAPLQSAQFLGLSSAVGTDANGDGGSGDSGGGDGGGGGV